MLAAVLTRLRMFWQRRRVERELDDELRFHVEMETQQHLARGVPPIEARRLALRDLGGLDRTKEAVRDVRASWFDARARDLRYALRTFRRHPLEAGAVVTMLALGIGVTTAMFTLVDAIVLRPAPFHQPDQLAFVRLTTPKGGPYAVSPAVLHAWRDSRTFAAIEAAASKVVTLPVGNAYVSRNLALVTPGIFELLGGITPVRGRLFAPSDGRAGEADRVLVSETLWRSLYGADPAIVGTRITVDDESLLVVGVLPAEFRFPDWNTVLWRAEAFASAGRPDASTPPLAYVRFSSQLPREDALRLATDSARAADATFGKFTAVAEPVTRRVLDAYHQQAVPLLAGGVLLLFLVLCANAAGLLLARMANRQREFAMRAALGAARARLVAQALMESVVLSVVAAVVGIVLAWGLVSAARNVMPDTLLARSLNPLNIDARALLVTSLAGALAALAAGLLPAILGTRVDANASLRVTERSGSETRGTRLATRALLIGEIAVACTLLVGAMVLVRSFLNLVATERGFDATGKLAAWIVLPPSAFPDAPSRELATETVAVRVRQLPGVRELVWSYGVPPGAGAISIGDWTADGTDRVVGMRVDRYRVGPDFFAMYRIPLLRGRTFAPAEPATNVVVGERFARTLWDGDPIGRTFTWDGRQFHVIGLAGEITFPTLDRRADSPEIYEPFRGVGENGMLTLRCEPACPSLDVLRQQLRTAHPAVRVVDVQTLAADFEAALAHPRATAVLAFSFAAIAVIAAAGGLFTVLTHAVGRRRHEFGVRVAIGATPRQVRGLVLRDGLIVALLGLALGGLGATSLTSALASLQYEVTMGDPVSMTLVVALLGATVLLASWWPAAQAMRADPVRLLRDE